MTVRFTRNISVAKTMIFESCFEGELRINYEEKVELIASSIAVWMIVDGHLAGEIYGLPVENLRENDGIPDLDGQDGKAIYCYSIAVLPEFRGLGLSRVLKAYWLGLVAGGGYRTVVGHATSAEAVKLAMFFGSSLGMRHKRWFGTDRDAVFYVLQLSVN